MGGGGWVEGYSGGFRGEARGAIVPPPGNLKEYKKLNVLI